MVALNFSTKFITKGNIKKLRIRIVHITGRLIEKRGKVQEDIPRRDKKRNHKTAQKNVLTKVFISNTIYLPRFGTVEYGVQPPSRSLYIVRKGVAVLSEADNWRGPQN